MKVFSELEVDVIVTDCASCSSFLKKYPKIFHDDTQNLELAEQQHPLFQDMVEFLATRGVAAPGGEEDDPDIGSYYDPHGAEKTGDAAKVGFESREKPVIVTYHDPCHAVRGQGIKNESRDILKAIPGVEFKEMAEADWCCGGAGSYALTHYELSQKVLDRKMENLENCDADILVTSCPACMIQLSYGIRRHGLKTKVFHISEMIAKVEDTV